MKTRVLVFPSCNEPGLEIVRALQQSPQFEVFGGSSWPSELDPSSLLCENWTKFPFAGSADFLIHFDEFIDGRQIDLVFATVDSLVAELAEHFDGRSGKCRLVGPRKEVAALVLSKSKTYAAVGTGVPVPRNYTPHMTFPLFAKPDVGSGSRGAVKIQNDQELAQAQAAALLVQEYLPGPEYTVDCVGDRDGNLIFSSVRQRSIVGRGIALAAELVERPQLEGWVREIADKLRISGPFFAQFKEDAEGVPRLMEVNARVGGSMGTTRLCGANIPAMAAFSTLGFFVQAPALVGRHTLQRSLTLSAAVDDFDFVIWDLDDTLVQDGFADPDAVASLVDLHNRGKQQVLLSKNPDPSAVLSRLHIPNVFLAVVRTDDKLPEVRLLLERFSQTEARSIMINDSNSEKLAFQQHFPKLRTIMPDGLALLGRRRR